MDKRYDKIAGSLIGGAIGDALGYQIEFKRNVKEKEITKYNGIGKISDDTQMTLFTANALIWRETRFNIKGISVEPYIAIYYGYLDWLETQTGQKINDFPISWIRTIPELNERRTPGNTCISSLSSGKCGTIDEPLNDSKGCGAIMRISPIGLYANNPKNAGVVAAKASAITHGHQLAIIPSFIVACMINCILTENLNVIGSFNKAIEELKSFNKFDKENIDYFINLANKAIKLSKNNIKDIDAIKELGEGWVAEEAFAIALYSCLKYEDNFENAIICAVNHDGDSDSTGAITGNILGTILGLKKIPKYYINNLELKDIILELSHDLSVEDIPVSEYSDSNDEEWVDKYIYCRKR